MNNARKTVNVYLKSALKVTLPNFKFQTGDEQDPEIHPPLIGVKWLGGAQDGWRPETRLRLLQIEVYVDEAQTSLAEDACEKVLDALKLRIGSSPKGIIPKLNLSAGLPGIPLGTNIVLSLQEGQGWLALEGPQQQARLYVLTVEVEYVPG